MVRFYHISSKRRRLLRNKDKEQLKSYGAELVEFYTLFGCFNKSLAREN